MYTAMLPTTDSVRQRAMFCTAHLNDKQGILCRNESRRQVDYDMCHFLRACMRIDAEQSSASHVRH